MINVLVTGGNGQLTSCIKDVEKKFDGLNVMYTDSQELDICDLNQVQSFFKSHDIDYCVNCAAYTAVDKAEDEQELAFKVNAKGVKNLALACKEYHVVLIHISTDFVFDGIKREPYTEGDQPNPISVYGASKLQGEIEIQNILEKYFIIRTSWLYSEHGNNFMKTMLCLAETRDAISVVADQIGTPTYAGDLAKVILDIVKNKTNEFGVYHYSNEGEISWFDFAKEIFKIANLNIELIPIDSSKYITKAKRPTYSVLSKEKIKNKLGVEVPHWSFSLKKVLIKE
ncbi:dTDP-4-dehydrorhamnose reductase [Aestuariibaculum sp. M13]|uniref:dTDP-4-dehydrorhamnose reductase n=1 Tax=Aestuariibaculum sp. M13 TaxID=2967132 RepID=UPI00215A0B23|nr:dTDP-4-dehydrorhamnose reductase [Aestuariibaculum sp. M13]MCR8667212.1 dTDP-4-dehydrorhamnose reductase [Aestuariibaculum sp. M13]